MTSLATQRCFNHPFREAVARCPECFRFYCRECITEHEGRVICATCLGKFKGRPKKSGGGIRRITAIARCGIALLIAWLFFYSIARSLVAIPSSFHARALWSLLNPQALGEDVE
jgi:hypothetical protein